MLRGDRHGGGHGKAAGGESCSASQCAQCGALRAHSNRNTDLTAGYLGVKFTREIWVEEMLV